MRSIQVLGKKVTGWQVLPADTPDFEEAALRACELVLARDPRIGKVPKAWRTSRGPVERGRKANSSPERHRRVWVRSIGRKLDGPMPRFHRINFPLNSLHSIDRAVGQH
jgi:hypothetical protein